MKALATRHAGSLTAIGIMLLFALGAILTLGGCAAQRQLSPKPGRHDVVGILTKPAGPFAAAPDSIAPPLGYEARGKVRTKAERQKARELRRWHRQFQAAAERVKTGQTMPRKCKGCTIVYGTATVAGKKATVAAGDNAVASHIEKKVGPAVVGSDSVSQNTVGTGNLAAINGDGNTTTQTKADVEPPSIGATIAGAIATPLGKVAAVLLLASVGYGVYRLWPLLRRKDSPNTTA